AGRYLLFGLQGSRQQKLLVLRFFDVKEQQGIDSKRAKRMASMNTRLNIKKLDGNIVKSMEVQNKLGSNNLALVLKLESMKYMMKNMFGLRWNCRELKGIVKLRGYNQFTYLVNGSPSSAIGFKNPIDMLAGFGWLASIKHGMLEPVKVKCIFLGYHKSIVDNKLWRLDDVTSKVALYMNMGFNESEEYNKTFICSSVGTGSMQVLHGFEFEVKPLGDHTFKLARDKDQHLACELFGYREDSNEAAFAFASVEKIYVHESLTFDNTVACKAEIWVSLLVKSKGNILGLKIIRDQSGNTLRVSQSKIYNSKLVQTLLEGHSILSLEGSLSGDCDVQKNASISVDMLDRLDRGLQTNIQVFFDFDYAMGRSITIMSRSMRGYGLILECVGSLKAYLQHIKAWKKEIWLKRLLTESGCELRLVAGIATGALVKGCSRSKVPTQVKVVAYRY
nr:zinc finger, CCHC-type [Tanacetum cinerariifolium]